MTKPEGDEKAPKGPHSLAVLRENPEGNMGWGVELGTLQVLEIGIF